MPLLPARAPLPNRPLRIAVAGTTGAGKTTLARHLAERLDLPYTELDSLFHGPNWTPRPEFEADVHRLLSGPEWVMEWQYGQVRPAITARATLLIWLDLPVPLVMWQVTRRTLIRRRRREVLWNGNQEPGLRGILTEQDHIVRWAWQTRRKIGPRMEQLLAEHPGLPILRLRTRAEVNRFVASL